MVSEKQMILDQKKWLDGIKYGKDMCGEYEFCCVCKKSEKNPCEKAYNRYVHSGKAYQARAKAKFKVDGKELDFRSTIVEKNK